MQEVQPIQIVRFKGGELHQFSDKVLMFRYQVEKEILVTHLKAGLKARKSIIGNQPFYYILDSVQGSKKFSEEAKAWVSVNPESSEVRLADFVLINSWKSNFEVLLYNYLFKPIRKLKTVKTVQEALNIVAELEAKRS